MKKFVALATLLVALVSPAAARTVGMPVATRVEQAPIAINHCYASIHDTQAGNKNYYLDIAADYTNTATKDIAAIRLRFDTYNDFYEHLRTIYGTDSDGIRAGAASAPIATSIWQARLNVPGLKMYKATWEFVNLDDTTNGLLCSVDTVKFVDGSIWHTQLSGPSDKGVAKLLQSPNVQQQAQNVVVQSNEQERQ